MPTDYSRINMETGSLSSSIKRQICRQHQYKWQQIETQRSHGLMNKLINILKIFVSILLFFLSMLMPNLYYENCSHSAGEWIDAARCYIKQHYLLFFSFSLKNNVPMPVYTISISKTNRLWNKSIGSIEKRGRVESKNRNY